MALAMCASTAFAFGWRLAIVNWWSRHRTPWRESQEGRATLIEVGTKTTDETILGTFDVDLDQPGVLELGLSGLLSGVSNSNHEGGAAVDKTRNAETEFIEHAWAQWQLSVPVEQGPLSDLNVGDLIEFQIGAQFACCLRVGFVGDNFGGRASPTDAVGPIHAPTSITVAPGANRSIASRVAGSQPPLSTRSQKSLWIGASETWVDWAPNMTRRAGISNGPEAKVGRQRGSSGTGRVRDHHSSRKKPTKS